MPKFTTERVEEIKAREIVDQLVIDDVPILDMLEKEISTTTFCNELNTIIRYIEHFADGNSVGSKMKYLHNPTKNITEFEFRSKHLRVYAIQLPNRKIIIYGGLKKMADSSDNIKSFRLLKTRYLESI